MALSWFFSASPSDWQHKQWGMQDKKGDKDRDDRDKDGDERWQKWQNCSFGLGGLRQKLLKLDVGLAPKLAKLGWLAWLGKLARLAMLARPTRLARLARHAG